MISFSGTPVLLTSTHLKNLRKWLTTVISNENFTPGEIYYIFCDDDYLYQINKKFLDHDTLTDIITFSNSEDEKIISGEIYISVDRVEENSREMKVSFLNELERVMVHGILHLTGYDDQTPEQKSVMRNKEDYYLSLLPQKNS